MLGRLAYIATAHDTGHLLVPLAQVKTLLVVRNRGLEARLVPQHPLRESSRGCGIRPILPHMSVALKVASLPPRILVLGEVGHAPGSKRRRLRMPIGVLERGIKLLRRVAGGLETLQAKSACLHWFFMGKSTPSPKGSAPHVPIPPPTPPAPPTKAHARPPESQARPSPASPWQASTPGGASAGRFPPAGSEASRSEMPET